MQFISCFVTGLTVAIGLCSMIKFDDFKLTFPGGGEINVGDNSISILTPYGHGVSIGPLTATDTFGKATFVHDPHGVNVSYPGLGEFDHTAMGKTIIKLRINGKTERGEYDPDKNEVKIDGIGTVNKNEIKDADGKVIYNISPDGTFKPAGWTDADWFLLNNPSIKTVQNAYSSDADDVRKELGREALMPVIYGLEIDYEEYQRFAKAVAKAVAEENPQPVIDYFKDLMQRMRAALLASAENSATEFAKELAKELDDMIMARLFNQAMKSNKPITSRLKKVRFKVGIATYFHSKEFSWDVPGESTRKRVSFAGPNTFQPYILITSDQVGETSFIENDKTTVEIDKLVLPPKPFGAQFNPVIISSTPSVDAQGKSINKVVLELSVVSVAETLPAKREYGLAIGDSIVDIGGSPITSLAEAHSQLSRYYVIPYLTIRVKATGETKKVTGRRLVPTLPFQPGNPSSTKWVLGLRCSLGPTGSRVTYVAPKGPAERVGINVGDVILRINGKQVGVSDNSTDVLSEVIKKSNSQIVQLEIMSGTQRRSITVSLDILP